MPWQLLLTKLSYCWEHHVSVLHTRAACGYDRAKLCSTLCTTIVMIRSVTRQQGRDSFWCCSRQICISSHSGTPSLTEHLLCNSTGLPAAAWLHQAWSRLHQCIIFKPDIHQSTTPLELLLNRTPEYKSSNPMWSFDDLKLCEQIMFWTSSRLHTAACVTLSLVWAPTVEFCTIMQDRTAAVGTGSIFNNFPSIFSQSWCLRFLPGNTICSLGCMEAKYTISKSWACKDYWSRWTLIKLIKTGFQLV